MEYPKLSFPFFGLLISGGHTMIVDAKKIGEYEIMGETLDDAIGEASVSYTHLTLPTKA